MCLYVNNHLRNNRKFMACGFFWHCSTVSAEHVSLNTVRKCIYSLNSMQSIQCNFHLLNTRIRCDNTHHFRAVWSTTDNTWDSENCIYISNSRPISTNRLLTTAIASISIDEEIKINESVMCLNDDGQPKHYPVRQLIRSRFSFSVCLFASVNKMQLPHVVLTLNVSRARSVKCCLSIFPSQTIL